MAKRLPKHKRQADGPDETDRELLEGNTAGKPTRSNQKPRTLPGKPAAAPLVDKEGLNAFERALVEAYCLCLHRQKALHIVQAKMGKELATRQAAHEHFSKPHVREAISRRLTEETPYTNALRREVLETLMAIIRANVADAFNEDGSMRPLHEMPLRAQVALAEFTQKIYEGGKSTRIKMANKAPILKLLMEHLGMFDAADPMEAERRKIEDAGPELRRRVTELGVRLRAQQVLRQPEPGAGESPPL